MTASTGLEPLLAAEHAAIYGYGVAGAALVRAAAPISMLGTVRSGFDAHRQARDQLIDVIATAGGTPPPPADAAYQLSFPVTDATSALRLLALLEDRVSAVAAYAVGKTYDRDRSIASVQLSASAVRGVQVRQLLGTRVAALANPLPGLPAG